jgi:hypothetical protein
MILRRPQKPSFAENANVSMFSGRELHFLQNALFIATINWKSLNPFMSSPDSNIQSVFLEQVRNRLPANVSFADELAELLNISRDSAYRRIRGETILSLEEIKTLYNRFGISIDQLFSNSSQMVTFHRRVVNHKDYDMLKWINSVSKNLDIFIAYSGGDGKEMIFSAKDIPIFHYFRLPELCAFKLFFWIKTVIGYPEFQDKKFSMNVVPRELMASADRMWNQYATLPSTEIWNEEAIYDTLKQIEFYQECGFFEEKNQAEFLCDSVITLLEHVQQEASLGQKKGGGSFRLFNNEILIADNTVFTRIGSRRGVYVNQNSLNLLLTFQEPFCEQTEQYIKNLIKKSTLISTTGERERNKFFNNMKQRVERFRETVR